ncbi:MAG: CHAD domain-containing protein [Magnetococcales bacterium]|nr:CHAD domain-containing protein [Magnetococcales bacterium]
MSGNPDRDVQDIRLMSRHGTGDAFGMILQQNLAIMQMWVPVAYDHSDCEGIHQMRVCLRKMRSALSLFSKAISPQRFATWGEDMRWIAAALGPARDLDVFLNESLCPLLGKTPFKEGERILLERAQNQRKELQFQVRQTLDSPRYRTFVQEFAKWLEMRGWFPWDMPPRERVRMNRSIREFSVKALDRRLMKTCFLGKNLSSMSDTELHALRIECKKMRYATDFFASLFPREKVAPFLQNLKAIQNILGLMNDVAVLPNIIDPLVEEAFHADVLRFSGAVFGWRAKGYADARGHLDLCWSQFIATVPPWLPGV